MVCERSVRPGCQGDGEFVDTVQEIECSFHVPISPISTSIAYATAASSISNIPAPVRNSPQQPRIAPILQFVLWSAMNRLPNVLEAITRELLMNLLFSCCR